MTPARTQKRPFYPRPLSFDGGSLREGGRGHWYPQRLTDKQLSEALNTEGSEQANKIDRLCAVGEKTAMLAAEEYIQHLRGQKSNFYNDEWNGDLWNILESLFDASKERLGEQRFQEAIVFVETLYPYLAFGCRNITEADKKEDAKSRRLK